MHTETVPIGKFKTHCLKLLDEAGKNNTSFIITKRGKPLAEVIPVKKKQRDVFGCMKGTIEIEGDIVGPNFDAWNLPE